MLIEKKDGPKMQSLGAHPHLTPIASLWVLQAPQVWFGRTHKTHWKLFYSWLWFIIAKGYSLKLVKRRGAWGRVPETSTCRASSGVVDSTNFLQQKYVTIYMECCQKGKLIWAWCPEFLLGLGHVHTVDSHMADLSLQPFQRSSLYSVTQSPRA